MNDEIQRLRETLATLHAELDTVESRDPEVRRMLSSALQEIADKLLAHESGTAPAIATPAPAVSSASELAETARQLEVDHPTLSATLRSLVEGLSRMGI
jgi:hypothetical protein